MANIRRMELRDLEDVVVMGRAMAAESPRYRDKGWDEDKVRGFLTHMLGLENHGFFVAERDGGTLSGMSMAFLTPYFFSDQLYAADLVVYVSPEYRGSSAAVRLVAALEEWAFAAGARELLLGVSTGTNPERAVCVYEKLGYTMAAYSLTKQRE